LPLLVPISLIRRLIFIPQEDRHHRTSSFVIIIIVNGASSKQISCYTSIIIHLSLSLVLCRPSSTRREESRAKVSRQEKRGDNFSFNWFTISLFERKVIPSNTPLPPFNVMIRFLFMNTSPGVFGVWTTHTTNNKEWWIVSIYPLFFPFLWKEGEDKSLPSSIIDIMLSI